MSHRATTDSAKASIYIVDDEPMLLELTRAILGEFQVETFRSAEAALAAYSSSPNPPDLLITDFVMGGMNGLQLVEACRKIHPRQRTMLLSGTVEEAVNRDAAFPADAFLAKPYQPTELVRAVKRLLRA